jgi:hypothetical protein
MKTKKLKDLVRENPDVTKKVGTIAGALLGLVLTAAVIVALPDTNEVSVVDAIVPPKS